MVSVKSKILFLTACLLETVWLLLAQVTGSIYLLIPCLVFFVALAAWSAVKGMALPVLLYFLPFSSLLKIRPGAITVYTIALMIVYGIYVILGCRKIRVQHLVPGCLLIASILIVKTLTNDPLSASFVVFLVSVLAIPFLRREIEEKYDFYWLTLFFALGIAVAAITSQYLAVFPTIARYIRKLTVLGVVRYSGYFNDPNFYAAHVTAAMSGAMLLLLRNQRKNRLVISAFLLVLMVFCGFLSVSKSFLLILVCAALVWFLTFMFKRGKLSVKITMIFTVMIGVVFLLSATVFTDSIDMILSRLSQANNLSDFTTGRVELWGQYIHALNEDPMLLLFGKGYSDVQVNDRGSHNTILQVVYQLGVVGGVFLIAWVVELMKTLLFDVQFRWDTISQICVLLIGCIGPWMGLDYLFLDEFFLIPVYVCMGMRYIYRAADFEAA